MLFEHNKELTLNALHEGALKIPQKKRQTAGEKITELNNKKREQK